jgi:hypothetical protein
MAGAAERNYAGWPCWGRGAHLRLNRVWQQGRGALGLLLTTPTPQIFALEATRTAIHWATTFEMCAPSHGCRAALSWKLCTLHSAPRLEGLTGSC